MNSPIRLSLVLLSLSMSVAFLPARGATPQVPKTAVYFGHGQVAAGFAKGGYLVPRGNRNFAVMTARRDKAGEVELHQRDTDIIYVVDGTATFVTGGHMVQPRRIAPDELRAVRIEGGETHHIAKGDVLVIPAGIPHWFKEVPGPVLYLVVKVR
jgi:quercetin dioxygenase-like cupin family protein